MGFLLNLGYRWAGPPVGGFIFSASGTQKEQTVRRSFEATEGQTILFDPQLYLAALDGESCLQTCAKLATYPWFGIDVTPFDSGQMKARDWFHSVRHSLKWEPNIPGNATEIEEAVKTCFEFQKEFGVTHLIAPTPLVSDYEDQFSSQLQWLQAAESLKDSMGLPLLATVSLADHLLKQQDPENNTLLQTILDNLTTSRFDGVYVLVVREAGDSIRLLDRPVAETLMYVSHVVGAQHGLTVVVNFADDLGELCLALGASAFGGGFSMKQRRLCFSDFVDRGGGSAYPKFYSKSLISDLSMDDLVKLRRARLLRLLSDDITPISEPLWRALRSGASPNTVPAWRQSRNNVSDSMNHRILVLDKSARELESAELADRRQTALSWLQEAEAHNALIEKRLRADPLSNDTRHIDSWLEGLERQMSRIEGS